MVVLRYSNMTLFESGAGPESAVPVCVERFLIQHPLSFHTHYVRGPYMLIQLMAQCVNGKLLRTALALFSRSLIVVFAPSHPSPDARVGLRHRGCVVGSCNTSADNKSWGVEGVIRM